jgi:hypothetical protein
LSRRRRSIASASCSSSRATGRLLDQAEPAPLAARARLGELPLFDSQDRRHRLHA